jgi:hypothetical protein
MAGSCTYAKRVQIRLDSLRTGAGSQLGARGTSGSPGLGVRVACQGRRAGSILGVRDALVEGGPLRLGRSCWGGVGSELGPRRPSGSPDLPPLVAGRTVLPKGESGRDVPRSRAGRTLALLLMGRNTNGAIVAIVRRDRALWRRQLACLDARLRGHSRLRLSGEPGSIRRL